MLQFLLKLSAIHNAATKGIFQKHHKTWWPTFTFKEVEKIFFTASEVVNHGIHRWLGLIWNLKTKIHLLWGLISQKLMIKMVDQNSRTNSFSLLLDGDAQKCLWSLWPSIRCLFLEGASPLKLTDCWSTHMASEARLKNGLVSVLFAQF